MSRPVRSSWRTRVRMHKQPVGCGLSSLIKRQPHGWHVREDLRCDSRVRRQLDGDDSLERCGDASERDGDCHGASDGCLRQSVDAGEPGGDGGGDAADCHHQPDRRHDIINNAEAHATGGVALGGTVTGLAQGATFNVSLTDGTFSKSYTATVGSGGSWTATIPSSDAVTLTNGPATVSAKVTDAYGNVSTLVSQAVTVAETLPTLTISTTGGTTNQATPTISGTVSATTVAPCGGCIMMGRVFPVGASRARNTFSGAGWRAGSRANARPNLWPARSRGSAAARRPTNSSAWLDPSS